MKGKRLGHLVACAVAGLLASGTALSAEGTTLGKCFAKDNSCAGHVKVSHDGKVLSNSCAGLAVDGVTQDECTAAGGSWQQD